MAKKEVTIIVDYAHDSPLTFDELCEIYEISPEFINDLIDYEIIQQESELADDWQFDAQQLHRIKTTLRLQHDLEVNLPGVAIILDLLDELEELRTKVDLIEKHYL